MKRRAKFRIKKRFYPYCLLPTVYCLLVIGTAWAGGFEVKFEDPSLKGSEERLKPGKRFTVTFDKPGDYNYYCKIHLDQGMKGKIVVR